MVERTGPLARIELVLPSFGRFTGYFVVDLELKNRNPKLCRNIVRLFYIKDLNAKIKPSENPRTRQISKEFGLKRRQKDKSLFH